MLLILPSVSFAQELSYTHYDTRDGLAGSTVFCMTRDKEGFLWFGTETGLSRFDGTHFTTFTVKDGLPDNEILQLFTDSKGRIWMSPYSNAICYYYKGKFYNQENDPSLAKLQLSGNVYYLAEDQEGNILMKEIDRLHVLKANGNVYTILQMNDRPLVGTTIGTSANTGRFLVLERDTLYQLYNDRFHPYAMLNLRSERQQHPLFSSISNDWVAYRDEQVINVENVKTHQRYRLKIPTTFLRVAFLNDSLFFMSSQAGVQVYDLKDFNHPITYLKGRPVSSMLVDQENSLWFGTLGHGIYRLNAAHLRNLVLSGKDNIKLGVFTSFKLRNTVTSGTDLNYLVQTAVKGDELKVIRKVNLNQYEERTKILGGAALHNGQVLLATDQTLAKTTPDLRLLRNNIMGVKSMEVMDDGELLVATNQNLVIFDPYTFKIVDTIWHERAISAYYRNDTFFIGTLRGLYLKTKKGITFCGATIPALKNRVSMIREAKDGTLWIGTFNGGILGYKGGQVIAHLTVEQGLSSNTCRCLFLEGSNLWAGTDKGLNKINIGAPGYPVVKYSTADGLAADIINSVFVDSHNVFIGTPEGLTWFHEGRLSSSSTCDLRITSIVVADQAFPPDTTNFTIEPGNKGLRVSYVGISYRSAGDIQYRYRLTGLDTAWRTTRETFLSYPTLPWGNYQLELQAVNKFGVTSNTLTISFVVAKRWWEKSWFVLVTIAVVIFGIWLWTNFRIRRIQEREREKLMVNKRINELEQLALRAQMNPHFIFNTLNSIQHYVMDKDIAGANKFIATFSRLIRQTMYFSSKSYITLSEEIAYLGTYLELEKDRLEGKFNYSIQVEPGLKVSEYNIPPMILQPYVENSVRHGIRYRKDNEGHISIQINKMNDRLKLVVEDNGVGRQTAGLFNSKHPIEYQSKGMSLTADRIAMLNRDNQDKITIQIDDLKDAAGKATGTRITVEFPILVN